MPTQCKPLSFAFQGCQGRRVAAAFDGGAITSNAGVLLLREIDRSVGLLDQVAGCFTDYRDPRLTEHSVGTLVRQRVMGITLGHEDLNDHDQLRHDPVLALLSGKLEGHRKDCAPLAGKSTLNRNLSTPLRHLVNQFSEPSFPWPSAPSPGSAPSTSLTGSARLIQTSALSSAARGGPATKRSGRAA